MFSYLQIFKAFNETFKLITYEEHHLRIEKEFLRKSETKVNNNCQLSKTFKQTSL